MTQPAHPASATPIAVVGMGCRVPGATTPEAFWELLAHGIDAVTEVPPERWDRDAYYDRSAGVPGKMNTRSGGFLDGIELFDPAFFGVSPRAAAYMDPQQRLLLEVVWEAFERAGIPPDQIAGADCGAFIGISQSDYARAVSAEPADINAYSLTGNALSVTVNRLSYFFDLRGPSMAVDSACSSSLVAVHLACESVRSGESAIAIAGGCNLILSPHVSVAVSQLWLTSAHGRCKSFSADADGYVRSEGCGVVILKRLEDARAAGDRILAVIRGSAVNQNGRGNGITAPSVTAQVRVISRALQQAGVSPDSIDYIEAHGSGSRQNDDLELEALQKIFGQRPTNRHCWLGSVKTNIGSLEPAGGIAGLIKAILALQHRAIPPHLHLGSPNPRLSADPVLVLPTRLEPWPAGETARLASVHAYGIGGTNAHVVVEEAPSLDRPSIPYNKAEASYPLLLSARTAPALQAMATRMLAHLEDHPEYSLAAICSTLLHGRARFPHRLAAIISSRDELSQALTTWLNGSLPPMVISGITGEEASSDPAERTGEELLGLARQWVVGSEVSWPELGSFEDREIVPLPTYPFQRIRCWYRD